MSQNDDMSIKFDEINKKLTQRFDELEKNVKLEVTTAITSCQSAVSKFNTDVAASKRLATSIPSYQQQFGELEKELKNILENAKKMFSEAKLECENLTSKAETVFTSATSDFKEIQKYKYAVLGDIRIEKETITQQVYNSLPEQDREVDGLKYYKIVRTQVPGTKDRIDHMLNEYDDLFTEAQERLNKEEKSIQANADELLKKIKYLLPGATAAGLAGSYYDSMRASTWRVLISSAFFIFAIGGFIYTGWKLFDNNIIYFSEAISFKDAIMQFMRAIFFETPFIWIGIVSSIKMAQYTRLNEEYRHKWSMMRIFDGMREILTENKQIESGNSEQFYKSLLESFAYNPSVILEKKYSPETPLSVVKDITHFNRENNDTPHPSQKGITDNQ